VRPLHKGPNYGGGYYSNYAPLYDIYSENIRCGWGGAATGTLGVETLPVEAGETVTFHSTQWVQDTDTEADMEIYHEGTGSAYLSRVEGELETNRGDGDWFKIGQWTNRGEKAWELFNAESVSVLC
jgi:hypothetical protein